MPRKKQSHCKRGHELVAENVYVYTRPDGYVERKCRPCNRVRNAAYAKATNYRHVNAWRERNQERIKTTEGARKARLRESKPPRIKA